MKVLFEQYGKVALEVFCTIVILGVVSVIGEVKPWQGILTNGIDTGGSGGSEKTDVYYNVDYEMIPHYIDFTSDDKDLSTSLETKESEKVLSSTIHNLSEVTSTEINVEDDDYTYTLKFYGYTLNKTEESIETVEANKITAVEVKDKDVKVYGHWFITRMSKYYNVNYVNKVICNGFTLSKTATLEQIAAEKAPVGKTYSLTNPTNTTATDEDDNYTYTYTFIGYTLNENETNKDTATENAIKTLVHSNDEDVTIYGYWYCERIESLLFVADGGTFDDGSATNKIVYSNDYKIETVTKYSHTDNISDDGTQNGNYGNNEKKTEVVTIDGAESLTVTVTYGGENSSYDWVSIFSGSHSDYTAASNYLSADVVQKLGGGSHTSQTVTYTVSGDSVTFAWKSDGSGYGDGYGYYAVVTASFESGTKTGSYKQPTPTDSEQAFIGWTTTKDSATVEYEADGSNIPKTNGLTLYAVFVNKFELSQVGKYADVDGDGTVDGVIFADLAFSKNGQWVNSDGAYSYSASSNLKQYYISQESYTDDFGTAEVISPVSETSGNDRFYIMALDDVDSNYHYWYYSAYSNKISDYSTVTSGDFGTGKQNTTTMIGKWNSSAYGSQNGNSDYTDMWGAIQTQANNGWFAPSRAEWAAFGSAFNITSSNYSSLGLSYYYWSSSLDDTYGAYYVTFYYGSMSNGYLRSGSYVRLAKTF